jgi:hypothetical protein
MTGEVNNALTDATIYQILELGVLKSCIEASKIFLINCQDIHGHRSFRYKIDDIEFSISRISISSMASDFISDIGFHIRYRYRILEKIGF